MLAEDLLTNEIIETCLKIDKGKKAVLISWSHENCTKQGENFFNVVKRIIVSYCLDGKEDKTSYVAKLNPCKENDAFNPYRQRAMLKEVFFYTILLPALNLELDKIGERELRVPKFLHSSTEVEREVIVFEDLKLKGFESCNRVVGIDGAHTAMMLQEIARLHAASYLLQRTYGDKKLTEIFPLLVESWCVPDIKLSCAFEEVFKKGVRFNANLFKCIDEFRDLEQVCQKLVEYPMEKLLNELHSSNPWRGVCHGDYHRSNVLFRYDESNAPQEVMILDWQTVRVAHPASEIDYFLNSSLHGPLRDKYFPVAINNFYKAYSQIIGSNCHFTQEEFETIIRNNHFGLLICFYLVPMSLCVNDPSELFTIDRNEAKISSSEALEKAKDFLKTKDSLNSVIKEYGAKLIEAKLLK